MNEIIKIERTYNRSRSISAVIISIAVAMLTFCTCIIPTNAEPTQTTETTEEVGHWEYSFDGDYWIENGKRQGVYGDPLNITDTIYGIERGREIYDPESDAWYWLDACWGGARARNKEVWFPYIFQNETPGSTKGKWCLYGNYGEMIKYIAISYEPDYGKDYKPIPGTYHKRLRFYHAITGALIKGHIVATDSYQLTGEDEDGDGYDDGMITIEFDTDPINGRAVLDKELVDKLRTLTTDEWPVYDVDKREHMTLTEYLRRVDEPKIRGGDADEMD